MNPARASWKTRLVPPADLLFTLLVAVAGVIEVHRGVRWRVGGLSVSAKSGARAFLLALLLLAVRHIVVPRPWLGQRVMISVHRVRARGVFGTHLSTVLDGALVGLAALALFADLTAGWNSGSAPTELPSGVRLALVSIALLLVRQ